MAKNVISLQNTTTGQLSGEGNISTLNDDINFGLIPISEEERRSDRFPTHTVEVIRASTGEYVEVGVAWQKTMKRGTDAGLPMFSCKFSDPGLPPWRFSIFPADGKEEGNYRVKLNGRDGRGHNDD